MRIVRRLSLALPLVVLLSGLPVAQLRTKPHAVLHALAAKSHAVLKAPGDFRMVGVSWDPRHPPPTNIRIRTSTDDKRWTAWTSLGRSDVAPDRVTNEPAVHSTEPIWVGHASFVEVRYGGAARNVKLDVVDPGPDPTTPIAEAQATPGMPAIITRAQWGADESIRRGPPHYAEPLQMVFIHHTATSNSYAPSDSAAIVRSIYEYHVETNGWDDIGYNFLVDRYGQIFEGRYGGMTRSVIGAHTLGFNTHSSGIAVIGSFGSSAPPSAAIAALDHLLAWRMDVAHIAPAGKNMMVSGGNPSYPAGTKVVLNTISGHRDVYQTDCPGQYLYNLLPSIRGTVSPMGDPKIYYPMAAPPTFTPNGDGLRDSTALSSRFSSTVTWNASVVSPDGKTWLSASGSGTSFSMQWNGRDPTGLLAPGGTYSFVINGRNGNGSVSTAVPLTLERFPSTQEIISERAAAGTNAWLWALRTSNTPGSPNITFKYGNPAIGDYPVVGDWNGNGTTTIGIVRPDATGHWIWYLRNSNSPGSPDVSPFAYGNMLSGDFPVVGDWNGDGTTTIGVVRPTGNQMVWLLRNSNSAGSPDISAFSYGTIDTGYPVVGSWNGTPTSNASFAAVDLASGHWNWNLRNGNGTGTPPVAFAYGNEQSGDWPVVGDWTGGGTTTIGVTRPVNGHFLWLLRNLNLPGSPDVQFSYGAAATDIPVVGDWNGSGHVQTIGIVRPSTG